MKGSERAAARILVDVAADVNGDEPLNQTCYEEYVRGFDEVPVLEDAVVIPPRRPAQPSFVRGERRSVRKQERPDGHTLREAALAEIERLYAEYSSPNPPPAKRKRKQQRAAKGASRKRRGKSRAAG